MSETIAAISTALMPAGIGVIRISGDGAFKTAGDVFRAKNGKAVGQLPPGTAVFGTVFSNGEDLDECVATFYKAPHSSTGEDVAELSCHGGVYLLKKVLEAVIAAGARPAGPGEFTKCAFLNGKMDLTQAEAVMDLIGAQGKAAAKAALSQHRGALYKKIGAVREQLIELSADITAWVDFPDEDVPALETETLRASLTKMIATLKALEQNFDRGRVIREGVETAIVGCPNVGKSTLMNALAGTEKSIVTEVPGTTRDIVEAGVSFAGLSLRLWDTAGIRETEDPVERIGVARAKEKLAAAQLVLAVFDGSRPLSDADKAIVGLVRGQNTVAVINKADLELKIDKQYIKDNIEQTVYISAVSGEGIGGLERAVERMTGTAGFDPTAALVSNLRQLACVTKAREGLEAAEQAAALGFTLDAVSVGIGDALQAVSELSGDKASDDVIDRVFSKFCIGK